MSIADKGTVYVLDTAHPQAVGKVELGVSARRGTIAIVTGQMGAGHGVDASVRCDLQNGVAVLIHDENVPRVVSHREVRTREARVRGRAAFKCAFPIVGAVKFACAISRDGGQQ